MDWLRRYRSSQGRELGNEMLQLAPTRRFGGRPLQPPACSASSTSKRARCVEAGDKAGIVGAGDGDVVVRREDAAVGLGDRGQRLGLRADDGHRLAGGRSKGQTQRRRQASRRRPARSRRRSGPAATPGSAEPSVVIKVLNARAPGLESRLMSTRRSILAFRPARRKPGLASSSSENSSVVSLMSSLAAFGRNHGDEDVVIAGDLGKAECPDPAGPAGFR